MAKATKRGRSRDRRSRTRRQRGGGAGQSYTFGAPIVAGLGNSAEVIPFSSCMATARPGEVSLPMSGLGLPGLSGGGKRRRYNSNANTVRANYANNLNAANALLMVSMGANTENDRSTVVASPSTRRVRGRGRGRRATGHSRRQRGGRYSFDLSHQLAPAAPWAGAIPQAVRIPCEGSTPNPLNPGPHTPSTQPPIQRGGVGGIDSAFYYAPTAGYTNTPSSWVGSTGSPSLIQTPYEARAYNPACLKTAGGGQRRRTQRI